MLNGLVALSKNNESTSLAGDDLQGWLKGQTTQLGLKILDEQKSL